MQAPAPDTLEEMWSDLRGSINELTLLADSLATRSEKLQAQNEKLMALIVELLDPWTEITPRVRALLDAAGVEVKSSVATVEPIRLELGAINWQPHDGPVFEPRSMFPGSTNEIEIEPVNLENALSKLCDGEDE